MHREYLPTGFPQGKHRKCRKGGVSSRFSVRSGQLSVRGSRLVRSVQKKFSTVVVTQKCRHPSTALSSPLAPHRMTILKKSQISLLAHLCCFSFVRNFPGCVI